MKSIVEDNIATTTVIRRRGRPPINKNRVEQTEKMIVKKKKSRFALPPLPKLGVQNKITITFPIKKNDWARMPMNKTQTLDGISIYYFDVGLDNFPASAFPDFNNPRSHDTIDCLRTPIAHDIIQTITESPEFFARCNRGATVIAESCKIENDVVTLTIDGNNKNQGMCDGATTSRCITKCQIQLKESQEKNDQLPEEEKIKIDNYLAKGKVRVEVIVGAENHEFLTKLVEARNRSVQLKTFSLENYKGSFDWLKKLLDESKFADKVAFDENQPGYPITDVISILTLFHNRWDERDESPVMAYSNKGKLVGLINKQEWIEGYKALSPIIIDLLELYEYAYVNFHRYYDKLNEEKSSRLGRRRGFSSLTGPNDKKHIMPLTEMKSEYVIDRGIMYPFVASLRAIIRYSRGGEAAFKKNPQNFLEEHGPKLVKQLINQLQAFNNSPNAIGKEPTVYQGLHSKAMLALHKEN